MCLGYHGVEGPLTVSKQRYESEIKNPLFEAGRQMGYRLTDPNGANQTGESFQRKILSEYVYEGYLPSIILVYSIDFFL